MISGKRILGITLGMAILSLMATGCGAGNPPGREKVGAHAFQGGIDSRMVDVRVLDKDTLLHKGDAQLEREVPGYRVQNASGTPRGLTQVWPNPAVTPYQGGYAENVIATGAMYFGTPYEYASNRDDPSTFDCSDFIRWVHLYALGMDLPKDSRSQAQYVRSYSLRSFNDLREARRGDLLFFTGYRGYLPEHYENLDKTTARISHVGIYLGNGRMIHTASAATGGVRIDEVFGNHLEWRFVGGGSVLEQKTMAAGPGL